MMAGGVTSLHLICAAAAFLAPAGRQPLLQRRVLLLAAKKKGKGKEAFVPYEISGDSVPMFPLPERRDAIHAHKKFGDKGVSPSKLAPGALDAHTRTLAHCITCCGMLRAPPTSSAPADAKKTHDVILLAQGGVTADEGHGGRRGEAGVR